MCSARFTKHKNGDSKLAKKEGKALGDRTGGVLSHCRTVKSCIQVEEGSWALAILTNSAREHFLPHNHTISGFRERCLPSDNASPKRAPVGTWSKFTEHRLCLWHGEGTYFLLRFYLLLLLRGHLLFLLLLYLQHECPCTWACLVPIKARKGPRVPLGLEWQMVGATPPAWVLGNELSSSGRAASAFRCWAISPAPT